MSALTRSQDKLAEVRADLTEELRLAKQDGLEALVYFIEAALRALEATTETLGVAIERERMEDTKEIAF